MRLVAALVMGVALSLSAMATVLAHAEPATAKPGDGAVLNEAPGEIVLVMSQDMAIREGANDIDVVDAGGTEVTTVAATVDRSNRKRLTVAMPSNLATGTYTVKWKTLSADDADPEDGELSFTYDPAAQASPGTEQLRPDLLNPGGGAETPAPPAAGPGPSGGDGESGVTWVLVMAVGIGMFVVGAGGTFLLVQRQP